MGRKTLAYLPVLIFSGVWLSTCGGAPQSHAPVDAGAPPPPSPIVRAEAPESTNAEAAALFTEARERARDRSRAGITAAIDLLQKAVRRDPSFTRAWAELAVAYGTIDGATDPLVRRPRAEAAARRAIALDGRSAVALASLGFVHYRFDWRWTDAEAAFTAAVAAAPDDAFVRHQHGVFLSVIGRTGDALTELERALALAPGAPLIRADMVAPLLRAGRVADARAALDAVAAAVPTAPFLRQLHSDVAAAEGTTPERDRVSLLERRIAQLTKDLDDGPAPPSSYRRATDLALAHAGLKHRGLTLQWLAVAIDLHEDAPLYMLSSPSLDFIRDDAQFTVLLRRARLDTLAR